MYFRVRGPFVTGSAALSSWRNSRTAQAPLRPHRAQRPIDENGDTTLTDYGSYKIEGGKLVFDETIKAG